MVRRKILEEEELIQKIMEKKEFRELPRKDVFLVYSFIKNNFDLQEDIIKETRNLLRKMYTVFISNKLLNIKDKSFLWFLGKHLSTKERLDYYEDLYGLIFDKNKKYSVFDLGSGINGFSFSFFPKGVDYFGFEAVGQLVDLQNNFFKEVKQFHCEKGSLFDLEHVKKFINQGGGEKIVFLFKVIDSLEMLERNYSKKLINGIVPLVDRVIISFATRSLGSKKNFNANRKWLVDFVKENYSVLREFELGSEKYIIFSKK